MPLTPLNLPQMANTAAVFVRVEQFLTEMIAEEERAGSAKSPKYKKLEQSQAKFLDHITETRDYLTDMFDHFHVWEAPSLTEDPS